MKKKYFTFLTAVALFSASLSSCGDDDPLDSDDTENTDPSDSGNNSDNPSDKSLTAEEFIQSLTPGIYEWREEDGEEFYVFAKSKDGWFMEITGADEFLDDIYAMPGKTRIASAGSTAYELSQIKYELDDGNWLSHVYELRWGMDILEFSKREDMLNLTYANEGSGNIIGSGLTSVHTYLSFRNLMSSLGYNSSSVKLNTVDETQYATYKDLFKAVTKRYGRKDVPAFDDITFHGVVKSFEKGWRSDLFPQELVTQKYVFPWTSKGNIKMSVSRDMDWPAEIRTIYPSKCDQVCRVELSVSNVSVEDVRSMINKIKEEGKYVRILSDTDGGENDFQYVLFDADHWYENDNPNTENYYSPGYSIQYHSITQTVYIKFEISYTRLV